MAVDTVSAESTEDIKKSEQLVIGVSINDDRLRSEADILRYPPIITEKKGYIRDYNDRRISIQMTKF
ncbi:hypothetical protein [Haloarcula sp. CBA1127]|uniref:hypothetical protein n=1 Tax=Haloarcula sp. CBA1127 TaxID=1765055 RepID=UPI000ABF270F|nr:hypothetical protein [Haloarcula sp. CBA1127]